jgi:hypothetical protein
MRPRR